jgi:hypothetical protein
MRENAASVFSIELVQILFYSRAEVVRDVPPGVPILKRRFFSHRPPPLKAIRGLYAVRNVSVENSGTPITEKDSAA